MKYVREKLGGRFLFFFKDLFPRSQRGSGRRGSGFISRTIAPLAASRAAQAACPAPPVPRRHRLSCPAGQPPHQRPCLAGPRFHLRPRPTCRPRPPTGPLPPAPQEGRGGGEQPAVRPALPAGRRATAGGAAAKPGRPRPAPRGPAPSPPGLRLASSLARGPSSLFARPQPWASPAPSSDCFTAVSFLRCVSFFPS